MKKLRWTQRIAIQEGIQAGKSNAQIAREINVHRATVGREIARNAHDRENYRAQEADLSSWDRQKEAMPKRFLVRFNGVEFFSMLNKRNQIYTYISRTHLNALSRDFSGTTVESFDLRFQIYDFRFDLYGASDFGLNHFGFSISDFGFGESEFSSAVEFPDVPSFDNPLFTARNFLKGENHLQTFEFVKHKSGIQKKNTFTLAVSEREDFLLIQLSFEFSQLFFIQKPLIKKVKTTAPDYFSIPLQKLPQAA